MHIYRHVQYHIIIRHQHICTIKQNQNATCTVLCFICIFLNYASRCVLNYKERNTQITTEHNLFYKLFIQLRVSTRRGYHQAGF
jgi:hypothetical protein